MRAFLPLAAAGALAAATLSFVATAPAASAAPAKTAYAVSATQVLSFDPASPGTVKAVNISKVQPGFAIAGLDVRPQNGLLYTLGVDPVANIATLYHLSPETGIATPAGVPSGVSFTSDGVTQIDLPDPALVRYGLDFDPVFDRVRVTAGSVNFRVDPNSGIAIDGNLMLPGTNVDGGISGSALSVDEIAHTNNVPNTIATTLYSLDAQTNSLLIQNTPSSGSQTMPKVVKWMGNTLDFSSVAGFDIDSSAVTAVSNNPVLSGTGYAAMTVVGVTGLVRIDLVTGEATIVGPIGTGSALRGLAVQRDAATEGRPVVAVSAAGNLVRFNTATPDSTTTVAVTGLNTGETLAAVTWRNHTGQLMALGIHGAGNTGSLYRLDPQTGVLTVIGGVSNLAWIVNGQLVDLPDPATNGYGFDVNPVGDLGRIVTSTGLNAPISLSTGFPADSNPDQVGAQPQTQLSGASGAAATAFTNAFAQSDTTGVTAQYVVDPVGNQLLINKPMKNGTLVSPKALTAGGSPLDIGSLVGFDLPREVFSQTNGGAAVGTGYAAFQVAGQAGFYSVDMASGAVTKLAALPVALRSIAVGQARGDYLTATIGVGATLTKVAKAKQKKAKIKTGRVLTCPEAFATENCTVKAKVRAGKKLIGKATVLVPRGTKQHIVVKLTKDGKKYLLSKGTLKAEVSINCPCKPSGKKKTVTLKVTLNAAKL